MTHLLHFNYSIGDKVFLTELPSKYRADGAWNKSFKHKEYEISGLGWELDEEGYHTYYRLYAYCDEYLTYHNKISDTDMFKPSGEVHPQDIEIDLSDGNGNEIKIGDNIIAHIISSYDKKDVYFNFTFSGEGIVKRMESFYDGMKKWEGEWSVSGGGVEVFYERHFICHRRDGSEIHDSRREGEIDRELACNCYKKLPDNYVENYVNACIKNDFVPCVKPDEYDDWDLWLEHFGIFEGVKKLYKEKIEAKKVKKVVKKPSTKKDIKKSDKLTKMAEGLSDKEKEELLKLLQK